MSQQKDRSAKILNHEVVMKDYNLVTRDIVFFESKLLLVNAKFQELHEQKAVPPRCVNVYHNYRAGAESIRDKCRADAIALRDTDLSKVTREEYGTLIDELQDGTREMRELCDHMIDYVKIIGDSLESFLAMERLQPY